MKIINAIAVIVGAVAINFSASAYGANTSDDDVSHAMFADAAIPGINVGASSSSALEVVELVLTDTDQTELVTARALTDSELDEVGGLSKAQKQKIVKVATKLLKINAGMHGLSTAMTVARIAGDELGRQIAIRIDRNPDPGHTEMKKMWNETRQTGRAVVQNLRGK